MNNSLPFSKYCHLVNSANPNVAFALGLRDGNGYKDDPSPKQDHHKSYVITGEERPLSISKNKRSNGKNKPIVKKCASPSCINLEDEIQIALRQNERLKLKINETLLRDIPLQKANKDHETILAKQRDETHHQSTKLSHMKIVKLTDVNEALTRTLAHGKQLESQIRDAEYLIRTLFIKLEEKAQNSGQKLSATAELYKKSNTFMMEASDALWQAKNELVFAPSSDVLDNKESSAGQSGEKSRHKKEQNQTRSKKHSGRHEYNQEECIAQWTCCLKHDKLSPGCQDDQSVGVLSALIEPPPDRLRPASSYEHKLRKSSSWKGNTMHNEMLRKSSIFGYTSSFLRTQQSSLEEAKTHLKELSHSLKRRRMPFRGFNLNGRLPTPGPAPAPPPSVSGTTHAQNTGKISLAGLTSESTHRSVTQNRRQSLASTRRNSLFTERPESVAASTSAVAGILRREKDKEKEKVEKSIQNPIDSFVEGSHFLKDTNSKLIAKLKADIDMRVLITGHTSTPNHIPKRLLSSGDHYTLSRTTSCQHPLGKMIAKKIKPNKSALYGYSSERSERQGRNHSLSSSLGNHLINHSLTASVGPHLCGASTMSPSASVRAFK